MKNNLGKIIRFFFIIFLCFFVPFSISNKEYVNLDFFPFPYEMSIPIYLLIIIIFFFAFLLGYIFSKIR